MEIRYSWHSDPNREVWSKSFSLFQKVTLTTPVRALRWRWEKQLLGLRVSKLNGSEEVFEVLRGFAEGFCRLMSTHAGSSGWAEDWGSAQVRIWGYSAPSCRTLFLMARVMREFSKLKHEEFPSEWGGIFHEGGRGWEQVPRESVVSPESFQTHLLQVTLAALDGFQRSLPTLNILWCSGKKKIN